MRAVENGTIYVFVKLPCLLNTLEKVEHWRTSSLAMQASKGGSTLTPQ